MNDYWIPRQVKKWFEDVKLRRETKDNAAIILTAIVRRGGLDVFEGKFCQIPFEVLAEDVRRNAVGATLNLLIRAKIIQRDGLASHPKMPKNKRKSKGPNRCNGYRFRTPIKESDLIPYALQSTSAKNRIAIKQKPLPHVDCRNALTPTQKLIAQKLTGFDVDQTSIQRALQNQALSIAESVRQQFQAEMLCNKQHYAKRCSTGRLVTSITACPKVLRSALRIDSKSLSEVDVSCCVPLLLCHLMNGARHISPVEFSLYQGWTETGRLYDVIAGALRTDRDTVKEPILTYCCGQHEFTVSRLEYQLLDAKDWADKCMIANHFARVCEVAHWFKTELPSIDAFLASWKQEPPGHWAKENARSFKTGAKRKGAHAVVSRTLQKLESDIVIEHCCKNLIAKYPNVVFATIHDCLMVPASFVEPVKRELRTGFASLALSPKLKVTSPI